MSKAEADRVIKGFWDEAEKRDLTTLEEHRALFRKMFPPPTPKPEPHKQEA